MTHDRTMFTIHYQDGRVEGPIGAKVVGDLIRAGVIGPNDRLAPPGAAPAPPGAYPEFASLVPAAAPAAPSGFMAMPGGVQDSFEANEDATQQMDIAGFHPLAIQEEIRKRKEAAAAKSGLGIAQPGPPPVAAPFAAPPFGAPQPAAPPAPAGDVDSFVEDLFASMSGSVDHRPVGSGGSYVSGSFQAPPLSVANPFANRAPVTAAPVAQLRNDSGFNDGLMRLGAAELRDRLLAMDVPDILNTQPDDSPQQVQANYEKRHNQIKEHDDARGSSIIGRAAIEDVLNIIEQARNVLTDPERKVDYADKRTAAGGRLAFNKFVDFRFAPVKPVTSPIKGPSPLDGSAPAAAAAAADKPASDYSGLPSGSAAAATAGGLGASGLGVSGMGAPSLGASGTSSGGLSPMGAPASRTSGTNRRPAAASRTSAANNRPMSAAAKARERRKAQFKSGYSADGDPFEGDLIFGVGEANRGIKHTLLMYVVVFVVSFVMVSFTGMGVKEFNLDPGETMLYIRNGLLLVAGLVGVLVVRKEKLERLGLVPEATPAIASIPLALVLGFAAMVMARLPVAADANFTVVVGLLALRTLGEITFFQGFIARTLLIEIERAPIAIIATGLMYGFYALTYVDMLGGSPLNIVFAVLVYGFGAGVPFAALYWKSRSIFPVYLAYFIVLVMAAYSGMTHTTGLPTPPPGAGG